MIKTSSRLSISPNTDGLSPKKKEKRRKKKNAKRLRPRVLPVENEVYTSELYITL
jgi:hypothetical protein